MMLRAAPAVGFANRGNTCYLASALQFLGHCEGFLGFILGGCSDGPLTAVLRELYAAQWGGGGGEEEGKRAAAAALDVTGVLRVLCQVHPGGWEARRQNDAHECWMALVERLHHEAGQGASPPGPPPPASSDLRQTFGALFAGHPQQSVARAGSDQDVRLARQADAQWVDTFREGGHTPLVDEFYGQYLSQVVCGRCGAEYHNFEVLSALPLHFPPPTPAGSDGSRRAVDLEECMASLFGDETIEGWRCDQCRAPAPAVRRYRCWKPPRTVVLMLKRFAHDRARKDCRALVDAADLDLAPWSVGPEADRMLRRRRYHLVACVCHLGQTLAGGHFWAIGRRRGSDVWTECDDESVRVLPPEGSSASRKPAGGCYMLALSLAPCRSSRR